MRFIIGLLTGIVIALIYTSGLHHSMVDRLNTVWQQIDIDNEPTLDAPILETAAADFTGPGTQDSGQAEDATSQLLTAESVVSQNQPESNAELISDQTDKSEASATMEPEDFQVAWMPFRSETSASGFATKLSLQLDRNFEIIKRGAGQYEVGFRYLTEEERDGVLTSIESMTGYRVPHSS